MGKILGKKGFSYVEIIVAVVLMTLALVPILQSLANPRSASPLMGYWVLSSAREKLEQTLAMDFDAIAIGSQNDTDLIDGINVPRTVTVALYDLDGDSTPEADAKAITVVVGDVQLEALKVKG